MASGSSESVRNQSALAGNGFAIRKLVPHLIEPIISFRDGSIEAMLDMTKQHLHISS